MFFLFYHVIFYNSPSLKLYFLKKTIIAMETLTARLTDLSYSRNILTQNRVNFSSFNSFLTNFEIFSHTLSLYYFTNTACLKE